MNFKSLLFTKQFNLKYLLLFFLFLYGNSTQATVTITKATGGTSLSADKASNAAVPVYTTLGIIRLTEGVVTDFAIGTNVTLTVIAPAGWSFNTAAAVTATFTAARDITAASVTSITSSTITVQLTIGGSTKSDVLTITGTSLRANDGGNVPGTSNLTSGGTATILGCAAGTNLGSLSQAVGAVYRLLISFPGQTFTDAVTLAGSGNTGTVTSQVASTSFVISKIRAIDQFYNIVTTYSGAKTLSYSGASTAVTAPTFITTVSFTSGQSTTALTTTLKKAQTVNLTVTDGTVAGMPSANLVVNPASINKILVEATGGGNIGSQVAGTSFNIQATAQDAENNTCSAGPNVFTGTVTITSTGTLSSGGGVTAALVAGVLSSQSVTFSNVGSFTITATRTTGGAQTGTSNSFTVSPGAVNNYLVEAAGGGSIATQTAGTSFNIRITARDANNNTCSSGPNNFTGTVDLSSTGTLIAGSGTTSAFTAGVLTTTGVTISSTGSSTITATRTSGGAQSGTSNSFTVNPATLDNFLVESTAGGNIGSQIAETSFNIKITARDVYNNTCSVGPNAYTGSVNITSTGTLTAGGGTTGAFTAGVLASRTMSISNTGNFTITATRTSGGAQSGTSNSFIVNPGAVNNFLVESSGGGNIGAQIAGVPFSIKISARDINNNTCSSGPNSFTGTVDLTSTGSFYSGGGTSGSFSSGILSSSNVTMSGGGTFTISATNTIGSETGTSNSFSVSNPGPVLSGISTQCVLTGSGAFSLTVNGNNFSSSSVVMLNGSNRTTTYNSPTQLIADMTSGDVSTSGVNSIDVQSPAPGGGTSSVAPMTINSAPVINIQPSPQTVCNGSPAFFSASVAGLNLTYQWYKNGNALSNGGNISGTNTSTLTINPAGAGDESASYFVSIGTPCYSNVSSDTISLTVLANTTATENISICNGQSYTLPGGSQQTNSGTYVSHIINAAGCDSAITTNLTVIPNTSSTSNISICDGQSYTPPGGSALTSNGTYVTHISNAAGCDSAITTNLTVIPNTSSTANISICDGQSYMPPGGISQTISGVYITHISNVDGCDSTITTNLTVLPNTASTANISICDGQSYSPPGGTAQSTAGVYITHIPNADGCDSTITTNLTVIPNTSSTANISICDGQSYTPPGGAAQTTTGVYVTHISNVEGCDSTITTNLTVIPNTTSIANISICDGQSYTPPGGVTQTTTGIYVTHISNVAGCDSTITTNLTVIPNTTSTANISICDGQSYTPPGGATQTTTGVYITHISNVDGCDSTITTNLTVISNTSSTANISICNGQSYTPPGGSSETTTGTYVTHIPNAAGCDSTITTNLTVTSNTSSTANISICDGQSYTPPGGAAQTAAGTYITIIPNAAGCDSTITTNLTLIPNTSSTANISICDGLSYTPPGGIAETTTGVYVTHISNAAGCDSTITTNLTVIPNTSSTTNISICNGQSYTPPGGSSESTTGTYVTHILNDEGCDSTITTNLTVIANTAAPANISICNGQSYTPPGGSSQSTTGVYVTHILNAAGCDSTITTNLTVIPNTSSTANISICAGQSYTPPGGSPETTTGTYVSLIPNAAGCDSTITTNLIVIPNTSSTENVIICSGISYTPPGGSPLTVAGTYVTHILNAAGCDSAITTNLTVTAAITSTNNVSICLGESVILPDLTVVYPVATGDYVTTLSSIIAVGCDSTVTTHVTVNSQPSLSVTTTQIICFGNTGSVLLNVTNGTPPFVFSGSPTSNLTSGHYFYTVTDSAGCFDTASTTINPMPSLLTLSTSTVQIRCYNQLGSVSLNTAGGVPPYTYSGDNTINLTGGTYNYTVTDANGCNANASTVIGPAPPQLLLTTTTQQIACYGGKGSIVRTVSGGTPPYSFSGSALTNLAAGTYTYNVTDSKGCTTTNHVIISAQPSRLMGSTSSTKTRCGSNTGTASINATGGSAPYTFVWNTTPTQTTAQATNLGAGIYQVIITDGHGCTTSASVSVTSQVATPITITGKNSVCPGEVTNLCATTGLISYSWNTGDTVRCMNANTAGTYTVTATNTYGCISTATKTLITGTIPSTSISGNNFICPGSTTSICADAGFTTYKWNTNLATRCLSAAAGGTYSVTVTNTDGCTSSASITVKSPIAPSMTRVNGVCSNGYLGSASVAVAGQSGPYTYLWNNGETTPAITELSAGTYSVTVTDVNGCTKTASTIISVTKAAADYSTISSAFLTTDIAAGSYIWFNSSVKVNYSGTYPVTIWFTSQSIQSSKFNLVPPNGKLILTNSISQATTTFNGTEWVTTAPPNSTGQYFISGLAYQVPALIVKNLSPVAWKGIWTVTCPGLNSVDWKWSAATYSNFTTNLDLLGVKAMDGTSTTPYPNTDLAGSPENYLASCIAGARTTGIPNYTGSYSGVGHRTLCAPSTCSSNPLPPVLRSGNTEEEITTDAREITYNAYPNPFTTSVTLEFERSKESCNTIIEVYNLKGQKVASLFNGVIEPGVKYTTTFDAENQIGGIYFYRIISGNDVINGKLILKK